LLNYDSWFAAMKAGHTFVTTGPMLLLKVNGHLPGDAFDVATGAKLEITAEALGRGVKSVEIIGHGKTLASGTDRAGVTITPSHGLWIAAKCEAGPGQVAHTTPVYVTVNGDSWRNPETVRRNVGLSEEWLLELEQDLASPPPNVDVQAPRHRAQLERQIAEARAKLRELVDQR
jgi:hypothetical protein